MGRDYSNFSARSTLEHQRSLGHWTSVTLIPSGTWKTIAPVVVSRCATLIAPLLKLV